jgi:hypothetical protein
MVLAAELLTRVVDAVLERWLLLLQLLVQVQGLLQLQQLLRMQLLCSLLTCLLLPALHPPPLQLAWTAPVCLCYAVSPLLQPAFASWHWGLCQQRAGGRLLAAPLLHLLLLAAVQQPWQPAGLACWETGAAAAGTLLLGGTWPSGLC